jgi:Chaperone of endosialidase
VTDCFIAGIFRATTSPGVAVFVNPDGKLGTILSSARFKDNIKPMDKASEAILSLKPVTFRYKKDLDANGTPQFGLVAEEVAKVNPDLVVRGPDGKPYTVRYEAVNAMLLNEFLKEHQLVQKQQSTIASQEAKIEWLTTTVQQQAAQIQKVSTQLEMIKPAPQVVENR